MSTQEQEDLWGTLEAFRRTHPRREVVHRGKAYRYVAGGEGEKAVFVLPGGLGVGEPFFLHVLDLEKEYKTIAPSYPDVDSFDELAEGVDRIAEVEGVDPYAVVGQSAGGILSQVLVRKHPEKVDRAVLAHTTAVTTETSAEEIRERVTQLRKRLRLIQWMPFCLTERLSARGVMGIVESMGQEESTFWEPYFRQLVRSRAKNMTLAMMRMLIDFAERYCFSPDDLREWPGRIMVVDSDADTAIPQRERENVRRLYPGAELHTFPDLGHLAILGERSTYLDLIRAFLAA